MDRLTLLPRSEPFYHSGNRIGCLLVHGFTGAPEEMRELGERLAAEGFTVCGPRLTHHGTYPADMIRSQWHDWYFSALDGYHLLRASCDEIILIGLSMGGATVLLMAAWEKARAVISLAAPIELKEDPKLSYVRQLAALYPFDPPLEPDWRERFDPDGRIAYPVNPVAAIGELRDYLRVVRSHLPDISIPTLLIHALDDATVAPINISEIYRQLGCRDRRQIVLEECGHVVTEGPDKERVFREVIAFIHEQLPAPNP